MNFIEAAFELCAMGFRIFPVTPGAKEPAIPKREGGRGVLDATDDEEIIGEWARKYPDANIGIACGEISGILVVDIDTNHGGMASVQALKAEGFLLPPTVSVRTPSGGWHLYYAYIAGPNNSKSRLGKGIDIRTSGGYVVAPPSRLRGGASYRWHVAPLGASFPRFPGWAVQRLRPREETPFYREPRREAGDIEALVKFMEQAPGGERNSILHWCAMRAGEAVVRGEISQQEALIDMINAGMRVGLDKDEAGKTARSGIRRGMRA